MPEAVSNEKLKEITREIYDKFHEQNVVCAVCDQICLISKTRSLQEDQLPEHFFDVLKVNAQSSEDNLHPILIQQYNVSRSFSNPTFFENVLLSPRGVSRHTASCQESQLCSCVSQLFICTSSGCYQQLKTRKLPKYAIANGNWIGQLPSHLSNMSYGTRSLLRPMQHFGRMVTFTGNKGAGGTILKGHVYSTKLQRKLVHKKVPLQPGQTPVRVLVLSPFTKDETAIERGRLASIKKEYIIEPSKIRQTYDFWQTVKNKVMEEIALDEEVLSNLPENEVSTEIFFVEKDQHASCGSNNHDETGGPSLLRSQEEEENATITGCTMTIEDQLTNETEQISQHFQKNCQVNEGSSNTFIVRPGSEFGSDSDPLYLERHYPDYFPFGRGGFAEKRKKNISRAAYAAYLTNLSTRQFQKPDFVLPIYNLIARTKAATMTGVRAKLPSRLFNAQGAPIPSAEAYGKISIEDLKLAAQYNIDRYEAAKKGKRIPTAPTSVNGLPSSFFTDMRISQQQMQHSQEAFSKYRQDTYAMHNTFSKAHVWLTISPDDANCFNVLWFALGPEASEPYKHQMPDGNLRFKILAEHPVAAAINFERIEEIIFEKIIGWNQVKHCAHNNGGLFGIPEAWLRIISYLNLVKRARQHRPRTQRSYLGEFKKGGQ